MTPWQDTMATAGRWVGLAARRVGRSLADAYEAVDPDARRHLAQMPLAGLSFVTPRTCPIEPLPDDGRPPVIFVHGLGGHRGNFLGMRAWLRLAGRQRTYSLGFGAGDDLERMAARLREAIDEVIGVNGLPPEATVDVVAHSLGGLVARLALEDAPTRARVRTLVTLGTPHAGTFAARFGGTRHMVELRPESKTLRSLEGQLPWRGPPRLVCFWSQSDVLLLPPQSACVEGAELVEMPGFTHYSYLLVPGAARAVLRVLEE